MSTPFTPRDLELLAAAMQSTKGGEISIDYAKFAVKGKYANANSAKAGWHALKKKLAKAAEDGTDGASEPATPAKAKEGEDSPATTAKGKSTGKSTAKGKKRTAAEVAAGEEGEGEEGVEATPSKPKAKTPRKSKKAKQVEAEAEVEAGDDTDAAAALVSEEVEKVKVEGGDEDA